MSRRWLLVVCALVTAAGQVIAQPAQSHVEAGVKAYEAGDYETAIREFESAYAINADPVLLYAWAQAQRQGGHCDKAIDLYRRYIDSKPTEAQVAAANTGLSLCPPAPAPVPVREDPPPPNPVPQRVDASPWYKDRLGGGLILGGVALAGTGATFLVLSNRSAQAASQPGPRDEFLEHLDDATLRRRIGIIGLAAGSGLLIAGVVRYATRGDEPSTSISVRVTSQGSSLVLCGHF